MKNEILRIMIGGTRRVHITRLILILHNFIMGLHVNEFLDWIMDVKNLFQYIEISQDKQVKLVAFKFKGTTSAWWQNAQN